MTSTIWLAKMIFWGSAAYAKGRANRIDVHRRERIKMALFILLAPFLGRPSTERREASRRQTVALSCLGITSFIPKKIRPLRGHSFPFEGALRKSLFPALRW
jgi:hypothetical protein